MNAADKKAWRDYVDASETFFNNLSATKGGAEYLSLTRILCKAFLAGRASRNSEVEGLREAIILKDAVIAMHEGEIKQLRQALTKGDTDAG